MANEYREVSKALRTLQHEARAKPDLNENPASSFKLPPDLQGPERRMLSVGHKVAEAMNLAADVVADDLRFEYMDDTLDQLRDFVSRAWFQRSTDHVESFIVAHARPLLDLTCFIPVEHLEVQEAVTLIGLELLPLNDPMIPRPTTLGFELAPPTGCVAAVPVTGTSLRKMAERARERLSSVLRIARTGLREFGLHDAQLRFRAGIAYAFNEQAGGWTRRSDSAYSLTLTPALVSAQTDAVWKLPVNPGSDIDKQATLALQWMERARFSGEPLIALLYLFFALEGLLGDKSEGLKAHQLAFRQLILSHTVKGSFRHPDNTWLLYDEVRSATVHGEDAPKIDRDTLRQFEWSVRDTLNEYLSFAARQGFRSRRQLRSALDRHADIAELATWIRDNASPEWENYLSAFLPPTA